MTFVYCILYVLSLGEQHVRWKKIYVKIKSNQSNQVVSVPFYVVQKILKIKFKRIKSIGIEMKKKHVHCYLFETN